MTKEQKTDRYERIYEQVLELTAPVKDTIARMATINALLHHKFSYYFWTGFYLLKDGELLIGPYQGEIACLKLKQNTGVCWTSINQKKTIVVSDVHEFPGHIACNGLSKSEIVVPVYDNQGLVIGVFDVDSKELNSFDEADTLGMEKIVRLIFN